MSRKPPSRRRQPPRRPRPATGGTKRAAPKAGGTKKAGAGNKPGGPKKSSLRKSASSKSARKPGAAGTASTSKSPGKKSSSSTNRAARRSGPGRKSAQGASTRPRTRTRRTTGARRRASRSGLPRWVRAAGGIAYRLSFVGFGILALGIGILYHYSRDLPSIAALDDLQRPAQITIVDRNGELLTRYGEVHGRPVAVDALPPHVVDAFLATEDRNFYHHWGVNPVAILRALIINMRSGDIRQGGSTITQQFAKNIFLTPDRTVKRKAQEMLLALQIEMAYSKDEILAFYLNNVYFGAGAYGLRAASERYFDKPPERLSVGEAAMLAGLLKAPSRYAPTSSPDAARDRAKIVLAAMVDAGVLEREEADKIREADIASISRRRNPAPYATDFAMAELDRILPNPGEDIVIHTAIDLDAHKKAQQAIAELPERDPRFTGDIQVALVALEQDGAVRLLIGGRQYAISEYNRATHASRQPGSAFKPFVYLAALEDGRYPDDIVFDMPVELGNWSPANYKDRYYGAVPMAEALARSLNAAAIHLQEETGRDRVVAVAKRLGFDGDIDPGAALALGVNEATPLELAGTYLPFANGGVAQDPYIITSIYNAEGKVLYAREETPGRQVVARKDLIALNHMLRQVVEAGSGRAAAVPGYVTMGKTGTTQDYRDAWFAGHAGGMTGVVWLGKDDYSPMGNGNNAVSGSGAPAMLWREMMVAALDGRPDVPYTEWKPPAVLPDIFDHFRSFFTGESDAPVPEAAGPTARNMVEADPYAAGAQPPRSNSAIPSSRRRQQGMDRLMSDVMEEDEAGEGLPEGDDLGAFLESREPGAG